MMTNANEIAGERMWDAVGHEARVNWTVWEAANSSTVLATLEVIDVHKDDPFRVEEVQFARDSLRLYVMQEYELVPINRIDDVFLAAQTILAEERIANGEA